MKKLSKFGGIFMAEWFYDRHGQAQLFLYEEDRFISKNGRNIGWTIGSNVYSLIGMHVGWYENGILYDRHNKVIAFKLNRSGFLTSFTGVIGDTPRLPSIPSRPGRPGLSSKMNRLGPGGWSTKSLQEMFLVNFR
jgi:hypothetical protein